jgi:hypothetical protein
MKLTSITAAQRLEYGTAHSQYDGHANFDGGFQRVKLEA